MTRAEAVSAILLELIDFIGICFTDDLDNVGELSCSFPGSFFGLRAEISSSPKFQMSSDSILLIR